MSLWCVCMFVYTITSTLFLHEWFKMVKLENVGWMFLFQPLPLFYTIVIYKNRKTNWILLLIIVWISCCIQFQEKANKKPSKLFSVIFFFSSSFIFCFILSKLNKWRKLNYVQGYLLSSLHRILVSVTSSFALGYFLLFSPQTAFIYNIELAVTNPSSSRKWKRSTKHWSVVVCVCRFFILFPSCFLSCAIS